MTLYREITSCRSCGSRTLDTVLDLGSPAISDFVATPGGEDRASLELILCERCGLVQLRHTVDRDRLYRTYYYRSGTNESMVAALADVVRDARERVPLQPSDIVLDVGANDGTLLREWPEHLFRVGFEPALTLAAEALRQADIIVNSYFPPPADYVPQFHGKAKVITSLAMFYDLDDPAAFVSAIKDWLHPDGVWVLQMPSLQQMLAKNAFDNICHEHLCYWPTASLYELLRQHGLEIVASAENDVNGASTRYIVKHAKHRLPKLNYSRKLWHEDIAAFGARILDLRARTMEMLVGLLAQGKSILGYGASTKGNTLLQFYGITPDFIPAIADRNPDKWGRVTAGSHIPIISEDAMREMRPDYLFVFPWHFIAAFTARERAFLERGGQFIVPLPELKLMGAETCQPTIARACANR